MTAAEGRGDTGILGDDLADVFEAIGEAARERDKGVIFLFDEVQFLNKLELEALIGAVHRTVQRQLPVTFAGAGLPQLPGLAGDARSYAERLFKFPTIGELPAPEARQALSEPARAEGVAIDDAAIDWIVDYTEGYPYFIQENGRAAWNTASGDRITLAEARDARELVEIELDESFFRTRVQRSTPEELRYMRAMADWPVGPKGIRRRGRPHQGFRASRPSASTSHQQGSADTPRYGYAKFTVPSSTGCSGGSWHWTPPHQSEAQAQLRPSRGKSTVRQYIQGNRDQSGSRFSRNWSRPSTASSVM